MARICCYTLTIEPVGVIFERPLEREFLASRGQIVQVRPENNCVRFGELGIGTTVQGR